MRLIAVIGVLLVLTSCSDSDIEYKCEDIEDIFDFHHYNLTLSADKMLVTLTHKWGVEQLYFRSSDGESYRRYTNTFIEGVTFYTEDESFLGCEQIN